MPTTANFSLEYPDDNSSVDIAGHFETLADDVDAAINTRLALTGGTLTGSLSGTSLSLSSTLSVTGAITGTNTTDSSSSTTGAIITAGGMGIAKALYIGTTLNVTGATTLTGNVTMSGDLTISKSSNLISTMSTTTGYALNFVDSPPGQLAGTFLRTSGAHRWAIVKTEAAESGSNAGSDLVIKNYNDAGSVIGSPLTITRSTSSFTLTGDLTVSKAAAALNITSSDTGYLLLSGATSASFRLQTSSSSRWIIEKNSTAESGSNAGSDLVVYARTDAGGALSTPLTITRSTGAVTLTGDLSISKASATARINATSGDSEVHIDRTAGNGAYVVARTGTSSRWRFGSGSDVESGSNVGSDFILGRFSDAGSYIDAPLTVYRSTGKVSIGSVGATAGLQLGAGGPRMMSGTGSPEGVVSAPVGSQWTDTAATTGAVKWIKASGTGNTGWVVEYGDTGRRNVVSLMTANATDTVGSVVLRRVGALVSLQVVIANSATATSIELFAAGVVPSGFRPSEYVACAGGRDSASSAPDSTLALTPGGASHYRVADGSWRYLLAQYLTTDAWPTSLPGSAA